VGPPSVDPYFCGDSDLISRLLTFDDTSILEVRKDRRSSAIRSSSTPRRRMSLSLRLGIAIALSPQVPIKS
jgi:hypothetical protein